MTRGGRGPGLAGLWMALALTTGASLTGCGIFHRAAPVEPEVTRPEPAPPEPESAPPPAPESQPARTASRPVARPPRATSRPDTVARALPDSTPPPLLQLRMTQEDRAAHEHQYAEDMARARAALESLKGLRLNSDQQTQRSAAEKFLSDAEEAFGAADLPRASALAQKSRIMAEELRSAAVPRSP